MENVGKILKRNTLWYSLNLILTSTSALLGIIISKRYLNPENFVNFNVVTGGIVLLNLFLVGWLSQSIIRFGHTYKKLFEAKNLIIIGICIFISIGIPLFLIWKNFLNLKTNLIFSLFFMIMNSIYSLLIAKVQSQNNARYVTISEFIRNILILLPLTLLVTSKQNITIETLWIIWLISSAGSLFFLLRKINDKQNKSKTSFPTLISKYNKSDLKLIINFGAPISIWIFISFALVNADKWYLIKSELNSKIIADYIAISDIVIRGIGFIYSPFVSSAYPVISKMYDEGEEKMVKKIINKIIYIQVILTSISVIIYSLLYKVLFNILQIEFTNHMYYVGMALIIIQSIWQMSAMFHKIHELKIQTHKAMIALAIATFITYSLLYLILKPTFLVNIISITALGYSLYFLYTMISFINFSPKDKNLVKHAKNLL